MDEVKENVVRGVYDVIIIGAGALGSAAAYHAARRGQRALLIEQYEIDHGRGSSHGASRIIRYAYDHPIYVTLAKAVYPMWSALSDEVGETLMMITGGLDFGVPGTEPMFDGMTRTMRQMNIPHEMLSAREAQYRFPQFRFADDMHVLYQADAGVLAASRCVLAHVNRAREMGAVIRDRTRVTGIDLQPESVTVRTAAGVFSGAKLIITAGAWAGPLLGTIGVRIPLRPIKAQENYFAPGVPEDYEPDCFPVFIAHLPEYGYLPYGLPSVSGSGVKVALHGGPDIDPDAEDRTPEQRAIEMSRQFAAKYLPGVNGAHLGSRACLYTMTPDEHFVIDQHPQYPHVIIGACCSGHAFKFSTLIGKILTDLAFDGRTDHDISLFALSRFGAVQLQ